MLEKPVGSSLSTRSFAHLLHLGVLPFLAFSTIALHRPGGTASPLGGSIWKARAAGCEPATRQDLRRSQESLEQVKIPFPDGESDGCAFHRLHPGRAGEARNQRGESLWDVGDGHKPPWFSGDGLCL